MQLAHNSLEGSPQCILRGCESEYGKVGDELKGRGEFLAGDCIGNGVVLTRHMVNMNIQ